MNSRLGIRKRFIILAGAHLGGAVSSFIATLVMVRALGAGGFGHIALGLAVLNYALVATNFGAELHAVQTTARERSMLLRNLTAVIFVRASLSIPAFLVIVILCASGLWEPQQQLAVAVFSLSVIVNIAYPLWAPQALERVDIVALCNFGGQALNLIFVVAAAAAKAGIIGYAAAKVGSDLIVAIGLSVWIRGKSGALLQRAPLRELWEFFRHATPLGVSQILRSLALGSDILILSFFVSSTLIGQYAVPLRIFTLLLSLGSLYFIVVLPIFSRRSREGGASLRQTLESAMRLSLPVVLLGVLVIVAAAEPLLGILFGAQFTAGSSSLRVLMIAMGANFVNRSYRQVLLASGRRNHDMTATLAGTVANLLAKLLLIPLLGIAGAAAGTAIGEVVLLILQRRFALNALRVIESQA
jgi:O-antigen/teichoic acid export membrane protein